MFTIGQIVYSKSGRDKGLAFVVYNVSDGFAYLVDGMTRKICSPKKKKFMHIQPTKQISLEIQEKITENKTLLDADFRRIIASYRKDIKDIKDNKDIKDIKDSKDLCKTTKEV